MSGAMGDGPAADRFEDLLAAVGRRDRAALGRLFEAEYEELRALARAVRRSFPHDSLEACGLVSETYMKLLRARRISVADRVHFFSLVARAMRQILIGRAEHRSRIKRGGGEATVELDAETPAPQRSASLEELLTLERSLERLASSDPRRAQVVELMFLDGLTEEEIAALFGLSARTVRREWQRARAFLDRGIRAAAGRPEA